MLSIFLCFTLEGSHSDVVLKHRNTSRQFIKQIGNYFTLWYNVQVGKGVKVNPHTCSDTSHGTVHTEYVTLQSVDFHTWFAKSISWLLGLQLCSSPPFSFLRSIEFTREIELLRTETVDGRICLYMTKKGPS